MAFSSESSSEPFRFMFTTNENQDLGFGFGSASPPPPPPPPCLEVLPSEVSSTVNCAVDEVNLDGVTLLKGRVSTREVFKLSNSDLVPGKYEGGLKLWEGSLDLVKALRSEIQKGLLSLKGKRVLELGCGHGLPGIFACMEDANVVHFQDFNAEVLRCLTVPNVNANLLKKSEASATDCNSAVEVRYFAGDWSETHQLLPHVDGDGSAHSPIVGYDVILMAETVYSISTLGTLYELIQKCMARPHGIVYMAAKKHYFGVGGGTRQFLSLVEKKGVMAANLVAEVADGSSNVREVWKLSFK